MDRELLTLDHTKLKDSKLDVLIASTFTLSTSWAQVLKVQQLSSILARNLKESQHQLSSLFQRHLSVLTGHLLLMMVAVPLRATQSFEMEDQQTQSVLKYTAQM